MGRVDGTTPDADLPGEERGFALLHPRGSDRNEVERDLRVAGYTDPGAAAAFGMLRLAGAAVAGTMTALTLWLSGNRSEEHTSELQSLMRISYAVFCLEKNSQHHTIMLVSTDVMR